MSGSRKLLLSGLFSAVVFVGLAAAFDRPLLSLGNPSAEGSPMPFSEADRAAILETVELFNRVYQDFYATGGDPRLIDEMPAVREVKHQIFRDLGYLRSAGKILVMDEAQSLPISVESTPSGGARATVFEEWNYVYQNPDTRAPLADIKGMGQGFEYTLLREPGRWVIAGWRPVFIERPKAAEGFVW